MAKASGNKTVENNLSVPAFIAKIADEGRRADAKSLVKMLESTTGLKPKMWGTAIIGFGSCHYVYDTGREGDMPLVSFSPRKSSTVLYGLGGAKDMLPKLGKHATSGGCIHVKKLSDVDAKVLQAMVVKSVAVMKKKYPD